MSSFGMIPEPENNMGLFNNRSILIGGSIYILDWDGLGQGGHCKFVVLHNSINKHSCCSRVQQSRGGYLRQGWNRGEFNLKVECTGVPLGQDINQGRGDRIQFTVWVLRR